MAPEKREEKDKEGEENALEKSFEPEQNIEIGKEEDKEKGTMSWERSIEDQSKATKGAQSKENFVEEDVEIINLNKGKATPVEKLNEEEKHDEEAPSDEEDKT